METLPEQLSRALMTLAKACAGAGVLASLWQGAGGAWFLPMALGGTGLVAWLGAAGLNWRLARQEARWNGPVPQQGV
jgi:hypothetical protein